VTVSGTQPADDTRLLAAFPDALEADVARVIAALPGSVVIAAGRNLLSGTSIDSYRHPVGITVDGEEVAIPGRIYHDVLRPSDTPSGFTATQQTVLACLYSRHHHGYTRQRWLPTLLASTDPWSSRSWCSSSANTSSRSSPTSAAAYPTWPTPPR
jgi:hypothetical protein